MEEEKQNTYNGFRLEENYLKYVPNEKGKPKATRGYSVTATKGGHEFSVMGEVSGLAVADAGYRIEEDEDNKMIKKQMREQTIAKVKERIDEDRHEDKGEYEFTVNLSPKSEI